jgi:hypothetical protein
MPPSPSWTGDSNFSSRSDGNGSMALQGYQGLENMSTRGPITKGTVLREARLQNAALLDTYAGRTGRFF